MAKFTPEQLIARAEELGWRRKYIIPPTADLAIYDSPSYRKQAVILLDTMFVDYDARLYDAAKVLGLTAKKPSDEAIFVAWHEEQSR